eukprot:TRINITY_DN3500_c1_g1_i3.p1 TRINITY_DN3500_c1_g1~~TRINITY_DN3500_c1_g1_i3.p1  ORF type:complete len:110 (+),score=29.13 TRINITY_DN3500_c1_g1_i3:338-667(+)
MQQFSGEEIKAEIPVEPETPVAIHSPFVATSDAIQNVKEETHSTHQVTRPSVVNEETSASDDLTGGKKRIQSYQTDNGDVSSSSSLEKVRAPRSKKKKKKPKENHQTIA